MRILTSNIKATMKVEKVKSDLLKVRPRGGVILWQEISTPHARQTLQSDVWVHTHLDTEIPISLRKKYWEVLSVDKVRTHVGRKHTSPNRYITWVIAKNKRSGKVFVFINSHFVSGAWNRKPKLYKRWRKRMWNQHYAIMQELVNRFHKAGYFIVGGGDWNRVNVAKFLPEQVWLFKHGIDYLFAVNTPGAKIFITETDTISDVNTDHTPLIVNYRVVFGPKFKPQSPPSTHDLWR